MCRVPSTSPAAPPASSASAPAPTAAATANGRRGRRRRGRGKRADSTVTSVLRRRGRRRGRGRRSLWRRRAEVALSQKHLQQKDVLLHDKWRERGGKGWSGRDGRESQGAAGTGASTFIIADTRLVGLFPFGALVSLVGKRRMGKGKRI